MSEHHDIPSPGLSPIHLRYARKLPYKAARLCALIDVWRCLESDRASLGRALREAHQLKGTAGAYGFMAVSRCAELVEAQLSAYPGMDWQLLASTLHDLLTAAKAQCEHSLDTLCSGDTSRALSSA